MVDDCVQSVVVIAPSWKLIADWVVEAFVNELPKTIIKNLGLRRIMSGHTIN